MSRPILLALLVAACAHLAAAEQAMVGRHPAPGDPLAKISSVLRPYLGQAGAVARQLRAHTLAASRPDLVKLSLDVPVTAANLEAIQATGATILSNTPRWNAVTVEATLAQAEALARITAVDAVSLVRKPRHRYAIGSYDNEADPIIRTDLLRSTYGADGSGMRIGVMSDSIHSTDSGTVSSGVLTGMAGQLSGDLPAAIPVVAFETSPGTDEGAGMMEEVHHLAPGAVCVFASCGDTPTAMATNIGKLASLGNCTVAVDDIGFYDEPMFQDGPIAQAADAFVAGGGIYLSAAGNSGNSGILQTFVDVDAATDPHGALPDGTDFHDWGHGTSNGLLPLLMPDGASLTVILQWNQTYHSYSLGVGAKTDFDLYLYAGSSAASSVLTAGGDSQGSAASPSGDPFEILQYTNDTGADRTVYLAVDYYSGLSSNVVMRLSADLSYTNLSLTSTAAGIFNCGTSYGHPTAASVLGIGAVPASAPASLEYFSSSGGWGSGATYAALPFYFDSAGAALAGAPQTRNKPDLCAPDGVTTLWSNPFFGTSSAAPHAAAAAALVWAVRPSLSNIEVMDLLRSTAVDLTAAPASVGDEAFSGHGLVDAFAASGTAVTTVTTASAAGTYISGALPITIAFSHPVTVTGSPTLLLNTTPPRSATYSGGSTTTALTFTYTIMAGDDSPLLDAASAGALVLGGATITDSGTGLDADLTLPTPGEARSLSGSKAIVIEAHGAALTITPAPLTSTTSPDFDFTFHFSHAVVGFDLGKIVWTNATATLLTTADSRTFHATATATTYGTLSASVAAAAVVDSAGYENLAASGQATYARPAVVGGGGDSGGCGGGLLGLVLCGSSLLLLRLRRRD